jgi:hypothetical protein
MSETSSGALSGAASGAGAGASFGPWGALAGGVLGGISGAMGGRAARRARQAQEAATQRAIAEQNRNRDEIFAREQPYADVGAGGLEALRRFTYQPTQASDIYNDPGYQFAKEEGIEGVEGSAAARGGLYSGAALKELTNFNSGNANRFFNDAFSRNQTDTTNRFNRAMGTTGVGERATANMNTAGTHAADQTGKYDIGQGNSTSASYLASGEQNQNALNSGAGGALAGMFGPKTRAPANYAPNASVPWNAPAANYSDDYAPAYKDGGPVMVDDGTGRMVPKLGTRTPRPGQSTGGGMSREAVIAALNAPATAASAPAVPPSAPPFGLNPRAVQAERERKIGIGYQQGGRVDYRGGGPAKGPGGPKSDDIPAWLSNGEHVVTDEDVDAVGGHSALRKLIAKGKSRAR